MKKTIFITFLINNLILLLVTSQAQWQSDIRLTNDTASSRTSFNSAWCIASSGSVVHVVWGDRRDGNWEIYYKRSTNEGVSWGSDTRLTNDTAWSWYPSVAVFGSVVHVVWPDNRDRNDEIYYKRSTDGGVSWSADTRLTNDTAWSWYPSVAVFGSVVHVVWMDFRDQNFLIYYKRSTDGGVSWSADTRLTNAWSCYPSVAVSGSVVHVVWQGDFQGEDVIYHKRSTDGGVSWSAETQLTNAAMPSWLPSVAVSGSIVHVVWTDMRHWNPEIYYRCSTDGGVSWSADKRLTNNSADSWHSSVAVSGSVVHVVWFDNRDGNREIYYKRSTNEGVSWGIDTRLTNNTYESRLPSIAVAGSVVHVVWYDNRDGNDEIYYKRDPTGNVVKLKNIGLELSDNFKLYQNHPNPFNTETSIKFDIPVSSFVRLSIFDPTGREIDILVNQKLSDGSYQVKWNAVNYSSGLYFYRLTTDEFTSTSKMILIK